mmetsp:Transcript_31079/g.77514  ORF Transcript_31079/g.77514 Transcript_31079/m.77514 type:complete len:202 (+) Transcript_31079:158-763(+)
MPLRRSEKPSSDKSTWRAPSSLPPALHLALSTRPRSRTTWSPPPHASLTASLLRSRRRRLLLASGPQMLLQLTLAALRFTLPLLWAMKLSSSSCFRTEPKLMRRTPRVGHRCCWLYLLDKSAVWCSWSLEAPISHMQTMSMSLQWWLQNLQDLKRSCKQCYPISSLKTRSCSRSSATTSLSSTAPRQRIIALSKRDLSGCR